MPPKKQLPKIKQAKEAAAKEAKEAKVIEDAKEAKAEERDKAKAAGEAKKVAKAEERDKAYAAKEKKASDDKDKRMQDLNKSVEKIKLAGAPKSKFNDKIKAAIERARSRTLQGRLQQIASCRDEMEKTAKALANKESLAKVPAVTASQLRQELAAQLDINQEDIDVLPGAILSVDYGWNLPAAVCLCGSANCRGFI